MRDPKVFRDIEFTDSDGSILGVTHDLRGGPDLFFETYSPAESRDHLDPVMVRLTPAAVRHLLLQMEGYYTSTQKPRTADTTWEES